MNEYEKIETLFERNDKFIVDPERLKQPVIGTINLWEATEKIDGTNIRIMMDVWGDITFGGRSDNAQIPADLIQYLMKTFPASKMRAAFEKEGEPLPAVVLYGEGYGAGIQKGGGYRTDKAFRLFDVLVSAKWWLDWKDVENVAEKLDIKTAPYLGKMGLGDIVAQVRAGVPSRVALEDSGESLTAEGIVARPIQTLFDKKGKRLIIKLKTKDFGK